jgi:hypothetical protein
MKVYVVIMECGAIHSVHRNKTKAYETQKKLDGLYENATVEEFKVE